MSKILILSSNVWSFTDKTTGEVKSGVSIEYIADQVEDKGKRGYFTIKATLSNDYVPKLVNVPGVYEVGYSIKPGANRQSVMSISDLVYENPYDFEF
ncbi:MAG: hypothetical protein GX367_03235 [Bacteroidales bacterium]|jgi:hypothetical protein|nr:hypothetical protein [Bacteroidales bacterium]